MTIYMMNAGIIIFVIFCLAVMLDILFTPSRFRAIDEGNPKPEEPKTHDCDLLNKDEYLL